MVYFSFDGDKFAVSQNGEWVCLWTGENWHINPITAWLQDVQNAAKSAIKR